MAQFNKISSYLLIFFNVLLVFLLIFEGKVAIPLYMSPLGRMHPLLLHLPIGFAVFLLVFYYFRKDIDTDSFQKIFRTLLNLTAISASIVALFGFFLSKEGGFDENNLAVHKWVGVAVSIFSLGLSVFYEPIKFHLNSSGSWALVIFMAVAGHFGANITHGDNYLFETISGKEEKKIFTENNSLFEATVYPIFEAKCISCHNNQKIKGELNMVNIQKLMKGGKNGPIWVAGDALKSHLIERANLPIDDKKHMPPRGKTQLTETELVILTSWINEGADVKKAIKNYTANSKIKALAMSSLSAVALAKPEKTYTFSAASETEIEGVNNPYCTVFPIANNSPALEADFFVSKKFDIKSLENLSKVSKQIVVLNLSKMPIKDANLKLIGNFPNLEKLILNATDITGAGLSQLKSCKNLSSLAVSGTKISAKDLENILSLPSLKEVFVWDTPIPNMQLAELSKKFPKINIEKGFVAQAGEILKLNPPTLINEEFVLKSNTAITLKHNLKNVAIHYTTDGTEPDSTTKTIYNKPIMSTGSFQFKAIATKEGWYASQKISKYFFKSGYLPDTVYLQNQPNPKYLAGGNKALYDLKKGMIDNNNVAWLGFKETDMNALFEFKNEQPISGITVSYLKNIGSYIMPPTSVEVWAGSSKENLKLIQKNIPKQAETGEISEILGLNISFPKGPYKYIKIVAKPLKKLPNWHQGKGQPAWIFVDEVLFN